MADPRNDELVAFFRRSQQAVEKASADAKFMASVLAAAERMAASLKAGGKVLLAGNGGSAADAQHIAAELVGRFIDDRAPLAAVALTTDTSALTAIGNDYGFEHVFARSVQAHGRAGDILLLLSTSGRSPNLLAAAAAARRAGLRTWALTGPAPNALVACCDESLAVDGSTGASVQEAQQVAVHLLCASFDALLGSDR
jgi:D-sedoheptulose 7-phosphate isomerase